MVTLARRRKVLPRESFVVTIESLNHEGRGIAHLNGKTVFIHGGIPGETVECLYTRLFNRYDEARVVSVITPSSDRVAPQCPHVSFCGGCSLQHVSMASQIRNKQGVLLEQLQHFGNVTPESILPAITGLPYGYRRKARLGVRFVHKKEKVLVGFRERSGRYVADLTVCPILVAPVDRLLTPLSYLISSLSVSEAIPQIEVAIGDKAAALVFRHISALTPEDCRKISDFAKTYGVHVYLQSDNLNSVYRLFPAATEDKNDELLSYHLKEYNLTFHFHPCDFIQVNAAVNEKMIAQVLSLLELNSEDRVLDLFSGLGNLSLPIAQKAKSVCAIEGVEAMVKRSRYNAMKNNITNFTSSNANLTQSLQPHAWFQENYTKIVLDPPRDGAAEIIDAIAAKRPSHIVYVSCNPATLARDAGELVRHGYRLAKVGVMDMFTQTTHIESIAQFVRN